MNESKIRFIGDIHGNFEFWCRATAESPNPTIQVGDFGVGFVPVPTDVDMKRHRFIRGNHDDPHLCKHTPGWIMDGMVQNDVMFIGGAWSIDQSYRTEGLDWWPEEELTYAEMHKIIDIYELVTPRVMVTHDLPYSALQVLFKTSHSHIRKTKTAMFLQALLEIHRPELWIGGHWHMTRNEVVDNTRFVVLDIDEQADVDLNSLEITFIPKG